MKQRPEEESPARSRPSSARSRPRYFDDPTLRVQLADGFREELRRQKQARVAASVHSSRPSRRSLDPSSVSRYAAGKIAPTLRVATQLARAMGKPLVEAVAGFAPQYARATPSWAEHLLSSRTYRAQALELIDMFSHVLGLIHLGVVTDPDRQYRAVIRPSAGTPGYGYFDIALGGSMEPERATDLVLSYLLFETPPVFVDFGHIAWDGSRVCGSELWTGRTSRKRLAPPADRIWVQAWIDGKAADFVVRSNLPFTLGPFVSRHDLPRPRTLVPFRPCGIHRNAPAP